MSSCHWDSTYICSGKVCLAMVLLIDYSNPNMSVFVCSGSSSIKIGGGGAKGARENFRAQKVKKAHEGCKNLILCHFHELKFKFGLILTHLSLF